MSVETFDARESALAQATGDADFIAMANAGINASVAAATDGVDTTLDENAYQKGRDAASERRRVMDAVGSMRGLMDAYGLGSLMAKIEGYIKDGYSDPDAIVALIRQTPEYAERFPAMASLAKKQRSISEAAYIEYERSAATFEQLYGLPTGMLAKDIVTNLITNEVSTNELEKRISAAAVGAYQMPEEQKKLFKDYYGIDGGSLTAYFLDPDVAMPLINKQVAASAIGYEAAKQGIGLQSILAETIDMAGVTAEQAKQGFQQVNQQQSLMSGAGDTITQQQSIEGNVLGSQDANKAIARAAGGRTARFQQGGSYLQDKSGASGLGSAATT
jgi:hypothetical protein